MVLLGLAIGGGDGIDKVKDSSLLIAIEAFFDGNRRSLLRGLGVAALELSRQAVLERI